MSSDTYVFKTSRLEIADAIAQVFGGDPMSREQLVDAAKQTHASTDPSMSWRAGTTRSRTSAMPFSIDCGVARRIVDLAYMSPLPLRSGRRQGGSATTSTVLLSGPHCNALAPVTALMLPLPGRSMSCQVPLGL